MGSGLLSKADLLVLNEGIRRGIIVPPWIDSLHDKQKAFHFDKSTYIAALCSRQAGKSYACATILFDTAYRYAKSENQYITLTRQNAEKIIAPTLLELCQKYDPGFDFNISKLVFTLSNGSRIWLAGCDSESEIDKFRGPAYKCVVIDEAQSFGDYLNPLINESLDAAIKAKRGKVYVIGTPCAVPHGYFYDITTQHNSPFSLHHWTIFDNIYIPHARELAEEKKRLFGWTDETAAYVREYLGRWCHDEDELIYHFRSDKNTALTLPNTGYWQYILSIDFGFSPDPSAFVVLAYSRNHAPIYVTQAFYRHKCIPDDIAKEISILGNQYKFDSIICDEGALGKTIAESIRRNYHIPIQPAEKTNKYANIQLLDAALQTSNIKLLPEAKLLADEWKLLEWNGDRTKEVGDNHVSDATLYGFRFISKRHQSNHTLPIQPNQYNGWSEQEIKDLDNITKQIRKSKERQSKWYR